MGVKESNEEEELLNQKELLSDEQLQEVAAGSSPGGYEANRKCYEECIKKGKGPIACIRACHE